MPLGPEHRAVRIVARILADIQYRHGFGQAWDDTDDDTKDEITQTWLDLTNEVLDEERSH